MKVQSLIMLTCLVLMSCAKEKKFEEVYKESVFSKDLLSSDPNDPYVYVPSVENTPMNVTASRPYWLGEQKLVIFKFKENNLEVLEIPNDKRYYANENNFSPVFKLQVDHKDYECAKDQYGDCSNKEEEVKDASWEGKKYFRADFAKLAVLETNTLPEQLTNLFQKCFSDRGSEVKSLEINSDSLNVTVERTLSAGVECADLESFDDLRNLTFKVNYHYSFIKLSKLASTNYAPVVYPFTDQNTFGFFTTATKKLTADNRTTLGSDVTYLNRWNPARKEVIYYLSDDFYLEGMDKMRAASEKAVSHVNNSFARAGVDFKIKLEDGRGKKVGDLRNNFLVMVKDPQASGVIGYGPTIANPITGEILKGQVVMYYGTIRKYVQETYDELVLEAQNKAKLETSEAAENAKRAVANGAIKAGESQELAQAQESFTNLMKDMMGGFKISDAVSTTAAKPISTQINWTGVSSKMEQKIQGELFSHDRIQKTYSLEDQVEEMSRHNLYHESMVNWNSAMMSAIGDGMIDLQNAKAWNDLSDDEKEELMDKLIPYVWIPTLVHEFGHNLGLRHNFSGSEDKANYYSAEERANLGIERAVTYSSVMDYSYTSLNQLPVMGKYDLAALRFGYNREIELKDGQIVALSKASLEDMKKDEVFKNLKDFKYCTDEHASVNANCNRFDEGSTMTEIAQHYVNAYKKNFTKRNTRNNRLRFSSVDDASYFMNLRETFQGLRIFFETFDRIKGTYPNISKEQWESMEFLKDLKGAVEIAANFYLEVLKTPAVHCAVVDAATNELAGVLPLTNLSKDAVSCFDEEDVQINPKYKIIAQTGKHFNHARSSSLRGDLKADPSQISVRGIWVDKILAMDFLMKREMGISTFDDYRTSFIDHPEFKEKILTTFINLMNDKIVLTKEENSFEAADGEKIAMAHTFEINDTHDIKKSFSSGLNRFLNIAKASTDLREVLFPIVRRNLSASDNEIQSLGLLNSLTAMRLDTTTYISPQSVPVFLELQDEQGRVGSRFMATSENILAKNFITSRETRVKLEKIERGKLIEVYKNIKSGKVPESIPSDLKEVYAGKVEMLEAFLLGQLPDDAFIQKLLTIMSK